MPVILKENFHFLYSSFLQKHHIFLKKFTSGAHTEFAKQPFTDGPWSSDRLDKKGQQCLLSIEFWKILAAWQSNQSLWWFVQTIFLYFECWLIRWSYFMNLIPYQTVIHNGKFCIGRPKSNKRAIQSTVFDTLKSNWIRLNPNGKVTHLMLFFELRKLTRERIIKNCSECLVLNWQPFECCEGNLQVKHRNFLSESYQIGNTNQEFKFLISLIQIDTSTNSNFSTSNSRLNCALICGSLFEIFQSRWRETIGCRLCGEIIGQHYCNSSNSYYHCPIK